jgi:hypothetical protein
MMAAPRSKAECLDAFVSVLAGFYSNLSDDELRVANARSAARRQVVAP